MTNIVLFVGSVLLYFGVWYGLDPSPAASQILMRLGILAALCIPLNIRGHVFTVAGNAVAEKSIFSLFSLYQRAGGTAFSLLGAGLQKAGMDAVVIAGLAGLQKAGNDAMVIAGLAGLQKAGRDAGVAIGLAGLQKADRDAWVGIGLAGLQKAGNDAMVAAGLAGLQKAGVKASAIASIAVFQQVGKGESRKQRPFGSFSTLSSL